MKVKLNKFREKIKKQALQESLEASRRVPSSNKIDATSGSTYYSYCPDNPNYWRSIRLKENKFTSCINPMISDIQPSPPPEGLIEMSPVMLQQLMRMPMSMGYK